MDGVAFQGMPRIALTPAEEALIPRPHFSASQVATAIPSTYTRTSASPSPQSARHPHHKGNHSAIAHHPVYSNPSAAGSALIGLDAHLASPSSTSIPIPADPYSRPSTPGPRPSSPSVIQQFTAGSPSSISSYNNNTPVEQEYPQNPQDSYHTYYSQVPPRPASPGPSRLAFALSARPARSPSPKHSNLYDPYQPRPSYFHRSSYDVHPRPGSPLQQEHQDSWEHSIRMGSPAPASDSDDDTGDGNDSDDEREERPQRPTSPRRSTSKSILRRLRETTSRLSFGDESKRAPRVSQESERGPRTSQDSSSTTRPTKEVLQDLSDEERQQEPRRSRSGWRPSLSLIRQESNGSNVNYYLQNDPNRISGLPGNGSDNHYSVGGSNNKGKRRRPAKDGKNSKKKKRRAKKRRQEQLAVQQRQQQLYEQMLAEQAQFLPDLSRVLEKKTRYPLGYDDFEAFLRSQRAVEYLNFWADVTAHEQLCRTFNVSERRQKREQQLEERAIARDRRRITLAAASESGRLTPDPDLLTPGNAGIGTGVGLGIGTRGQEIDGLNLYVASRSSLQLPLNDHLSFPPEGRRYGIRDSSAAFPPIPPSHANNSGTETHALGVYNRILAGVGARRASGETSRPSLEEAHISEQDAAVAAVAMRAQHNDLYPYNSSPEDDRRGSFDTFRPMSSPYSTPNAYNLMIRGRGSADVLGRSSSRNSRTRPSGSEDYLGNGIRRANSQHFQQQVQHQSSTTPQLIVQDEDRQGQTGSPVDLQRKLSQQSIGSAEPGLSRHPSFGTFAGGVGPLQAPVTIRRSGESAYTPSIFSTGQEGKAFLVQSFRTIGLEDLHESALRIYRKYLIQLRTASMAAEEEAAALSTNKEFNTGYGGYIRNSIDKSMAPGWDGYAEEVIGEWNEKWRERRLRRHSSRRNLSTRIGYGDPSGRASIAGEEKGGLRIDIQAANQAASAMDKEEFDDDEDDDDEDDEDEDEEGNVSGGASGTISASTSPLSARMRKRAGTGLSAFLTKLMRTETTVVELPTLTINTTTIEEAAVPADSDEDDDDEEDEDDDGEEVYDSDAEDEGEDVEGVEDVREHKDQRGATPANKETADENRVNATPPQQTLHPNAELDSVVVLDRSIPSPSPLLINAAETRQAQTTASTATQDAVHSAICKDDGTEADPSTSAEPHISPRPSISSSLSSSWDHITRRDLEKQVTILPSPVTTSKRRSPYGRRGLHGVRSSTGRAAKSASTAAQRLGWQLSTFLSKFIRGIGSNSSTFNTTKATPRTSPLAERSSFQPQVPAIATEISGVDDRTGDQDGSRIDTLKNGSLSASTSIAQFQGEPLHSNANMAGPSTNARGITLSMEGSSLQPPRPCITPATSLMTNPTAFSTPVSSPAPSTSAPRFTGSSPAAVAVSAAAAAFYLPLECRQRIHTQVQEEGRANAPYLFGPAKGFVVDVVLLDHYYPLFLKHVELQNLGLLTRHHPSNVIKQRGMVWIGVAFWLGVIGIQLALILMGMGGWKSPWVWLVGVVGGWTGSICLATGIKGFSPILGILGKMCEDRHLFRFRRIQEPSIRVRHRWRAYWMLSYCIFWSTVVMVVFAALPQRNADR